MFGMKSYVIVKEKRNERLKVLPAAMYLLDTNAIFSYELIESVDREKDAIKIIKHIEDIGGVQKYLNELEEKAKAEQKNRIMFPIECEKAFSGKVIPKACLDEAVIERFQSQLDLFADYLSLIRHLLIENDPLNYIRLNDETREEDFVYFKDVEREVDALKTGLIKLYYQSFRVAAFDKFSKDMDEAYETEQLIVTCPLYKLKQALYREENARDIFAKYNDTQIRYAIENYDKSKYQQMRREWQAENDIKQTYHITLDVDIRNKQLTNRMLEKCIKQALEVAGADIPKNIKIKAINNLADQ